MGNADVINAPEGQDKEQFLLILKEQYLKSPSVYTVIKTFGLNWSCPALEQFLSTEQLLEYLDTIKPNINQQTNNQMKTKTVAAPSPAKPATQTAATQTTNPKDVFKKTPQEIEMPEGFTSFVNFENPEDKITGFLCGTAMIPNEKNGPKVKRFLIMDADDDLIKCLPANYQLDNKLTFIEKSIGGPLSVENSVPVSIEFLGKTPHPSDSTKTISQFKVERF